MAKGLVDRVQLIWDKARHGSSEPFSWFIVPKSRITPLMSQDVGGDNKKYYFHVRVNQLFLKNDREWFAKYDPAVMVISEFLYDKEYVTVPFLVGPSLLEGKGLQISSGSILADTRVVGPHPFRGNRIILRLALYKTQRDNTVHQLLKLLENTAGAIDYSTALSQYLKLGNAIVGGIEGLLGLGKTVPVMALSKEFDIAAGDSIDDCYIVMINKSQQELDVERIWVVDDTLYMGETLESLVPYNEADFILLSMQKETERDDIEQLPFYHLWEQALNYAVIPDEGHWKLAKASLASLYQAMVLSPDLTDSQVSRLKDDFVETIQKRRREAIELSSLNSTQSAEDIVRLREEVLAILNL